MYFCGIDIGTTNTKAVLIDSDGGLIDSASIVVECSGTSIEQTNWYDQFSAIFDEFYSKGYFTDSKVICSITAQGGSFILLDEKFNPVSRSYSWTETAATDVVEGIKNIFGAKQYYRITGWEPDGWLPAFKLKELISKKQMSENTRFIATVPDFIYSHITGKFVTDVTNAQITGLCDFQKSCWDEEILDWVGVDESFLPKIVSRLSIVLDEVRTKWGRISFVTSSHDQYAAMQAAGLCKDMEVMLGSGTAWVINGRTSEPIFDDCNFITHPGRDLIKDCFGSIIGTGRPIGRGLDELLAKFNLTTKQLDGMEKSLNQYDFPKEKVLAADIQEADPVKAVKQYMEATGSLIAFFLEKFYLNCSLATSAGDPKSRKIIMSGGAAVSRFWPQVIAELCGLSVEAVNFSEFTAYGAALHAKSAFEGRQSRSNLFEITKVKHYEPIHMNQYQQWYKQYQKPMFEKILIKNCN